MLTSIRTRALATLASVWTCFITAVFTALESMASVMLFVWWSKRMVKRGWYLSIGDVVPQNRQHHQAAVLFLLRGALSTTRPTLLHYSRRLYDALLAKAESVARAVAASPVPATTRLRDPHKRTSCATAKTRARKGVVHLHIVSHHCKGILFASPHLLSASLCSVWFIGPYSLLFLSFPYRDACQPCFPEALYLTHDPLTPDIQSPCGHAR